jgi:hypothetical protein
MHKSYFYISPLTGQVDYTCLCLEDRQLTDASLKVILPQFKTKLKSLNLAKNLLTAAADNIIAEFISKQDQLEWLNLSFNNFGNIKNITETIRTHTKLKTLILNGINLTIAEMQVLCANIQNNNSIEELHLNENSFSECLYSPYRFYEKHIANIPSCVDSLCSLVNQNKKLREIHIENCGITLADYHKLANTMKVCQSPNLKCINLMRNNSLPRDLPRIIDKKNWP